MPSGSHPILTLDLINRLPVGILVFGRDGGLVSANPAAEKLLGH
ncbi:MAG: PAS domain-containing protein, partial [Planctomycetes bacterium]|nr:PAS domain-containing protein [Planctomycetota bacterium]